MENITKEKHFYVHDGDRISSGPELTKALENKSISDESFVYHLERGDFVNWIDNVLENKKLASSLKKIKTRQSYVKKLKSEFGK